MMKKKMSKPRKVQLVKVVGSMCPIEDPTTFKIWGVKADLSDFGTIRFKSHGILDEHDLCEKIRFVKKPMRTSVLEKYGIVEDEYEVIIDELKRAIDCSGCSRCL